MLDLRMRLAVPFLSLLLGLALAVPVRLACCAGLFPAEGGGAKSCCQRSGADFSARRCCQGDPRVDRATSRLTLPALAVVPAALPAERAPAVAAPAPSPPWERSLGPPGGRVLCLLHAVLLC